MHHGDYQERQMSSELADLLRKDAEKRPEAIGATGTFPNGKVCPEDRGEIQFAIGSDSERGIVLLDFGEKPVGFVAMTPQQALDVATALIKHARGTAKEPLQIVLH